MEKIKLRKFPYPFNAALSICSDIDGTSLENFIIIHKFLNTNQNTEMGAGLGLPIGDSFWMFDRPNLTNAAFSYFENLRGKASQAAPIIRDFVRAGILDVMHSYGNFATMIAFSRRLAVQAIEELDRYGLKIAVWTNHGGIESTHNIGSLSWGKGDIPIHEDNGTSGELDCYHSDLLLDYGIRFYWDHEDYLTSLVGQDSPVHFSEAYWRSPLYSGFKLKAKSIIKGYLSFADLLYSKFHRKHFVPWQPFNFQNHLIQIDQLRDGNIIFKFKRYGHQKLVRSDHLGFLLNDRVLDHLIKKKGYLILYIHLGDQKVKQDTIPLPLETIEKFRQLADFYHTGKIWIETTSRLLNYNFIHKYLKWSVTSTDSQYRIKIERLNASVPAYDLSQNDLSGLTFVCPNDKEAVIFFKEQKIPYKVHFEKEKNQQNVMIPIKKLEWPL
jgi:hypothetical protein